MEKENATWSRGEEQRKWLILFGSLSVVAAGLVSHLVCLVSQDFYSLSRVNDEGGRGKKLENWRKRQFSLIRNITILFTFACTIDLLKG